MISMGEKVENGSNNMKKMFKPSIGKVIIFIILVFILTFLPLYPIHVDKYVGSEEYDVNELEFSGTRLRSLYDVIDGEYNWTELDMTFRQESLFYRFTYYHVSYCDANPLFLAIYGIMIFGTYYASCSYIESEKKN